MTSSPTPWDNRICVFDSATVRIDYATGDVTAATGRTARAWAQEPGALQGVRWGLSFGIEVADVECDQILPPRLPDGISAIAALIVTLVIRTFGSSRRSMCRMMGLAETAAHFTSRPAPAEEAERTIASVRWAARWIPFRVACLEESIAAVLVLATRRQRVTWCHGVAPDPVQFHAWIQIEGGPVAEPSTTSRYTVLRTIP